MRLARLLPLLLPGLLSAQDPFIPANDARHEVAMFGNRRTQGLEFGIRDGSHHMQEGIGALYEGHRPGAEGPGAEVYVWGGPSWAGRTRFQAGWALSAGSITLGGFGVKLSGGVYLTPHLFIGASSQAVAGIRRSYGFAGIEAGASW